MDIILIENARWTCPRCNADNVVCIELKETDRVKCLTCQVYFHRVGWTYRFESADNNKIFIPEAKMQNNSQNPRTNNLRV